MCTSMICFVSELFLHNLEVDYHYLLSMASNSHQRDVSQLEQDEMVSDGFSVWNHVILFLTNS